MQAMPLKEVRSHLCLKMYMEFIIPYQLHLPLPASFALGQALDGMMSATIFKPNVANQTTSTTPAQQDPATILSRIKIREPITLLNLKFPKLEDSSMATCQSEAHEPSNPALQQQISLEANSDRVAEALSVQLQDGVAVISSEYRHAITLGFDLWLSLVEAAASDGGSPSGHLQQSPAFQLQDVFLRNRPTATCATAFYESTADGRGEGKLGVEHLHALLPAEPQMARRSEGSLLIVICLLIALVSFTLGSACGGLLRKASNPSATRYIGSHADDSKCNVMRPSLSGVPLPEHMPCSPEPLKHLALTPGAGSGTASGTDSRHASRTVLSGRDLPCASPMPRLPLHDMLGDSASSPVLGKPIPSSPSWGSMHSSDLHPSQPSQTKALTGSQQPRSILRRQSSRWARTDDGRLRSVLQAAADEEDEADLYNTMDQ